MKATFVYNCLVGIIIILNCSKCDSLISDKEYPLYLINNASYSVGYYIALGDGYATTAFPDTTLPVKNIFIDVVIKSKEKAIIYNGSGKWEEVYENSLPADTLSIFIFHRDTLDKYSWEEIRSSYKVLKRYDLSFDDLKKNDWTVTYP